MQVIGLNPRGGATAWKHPASPADITAGLAPELPVIAGNVVYIQALSGAGELASADPATGNISWTSPLADFTSWPEPCPGDPADVCATSVTDTGTTELRFNGTTGAPLHSPLVSSGVGRELAPGLFDPGLRGQEGLVALDGARVAWSQPLASVFTMPGLSANNGWNFDRLPRIGMYVGSEFGSASTKIGTHTVYTLSDTMTAGFRISNGASVWRNAGTYYVCSELPCPGADTATSDGSGAGDSHGPTLGLRLRMTGALLAGTATLNEPKAASRVDVIVEGFNLATGHTAWSFDAGSDTGLAAQTQLPPRLTDTTIALPNPAGQPTEVDLSNGAEHSAAAGATGWCKTFTTYHVTAAARTSNGAPIASYVGQYALSPCDLRSHPAATPTRVPTFVGPTDAGLIAWSEPNKVVGAPADD